VRISLGQEGQTHSATGQSDARRASKASESSREQRTLQNTELSKPCQPWDRHPDPCRRSNSPSSVHLASLLENDGERLYEARINIQNPTAKNISARDENES
jgi:hypothetical protein